MQRRGGPPPANGAHKPRHWHLAATLLCCLLVRIATFYLTHILQGSEYTYIHQLISLEGEGTPHGGPHKRGRLSHPGEETRYFPFNQSNETKELQEYFQRNKRSGNLKQKQKEKIKINPKQFLIKNDSMHYAFNSDVYNLKYLYESDVLGRLSADVYSSLTVRVNPLLLKALQFALLRGGGGSGSGSGERGERGGRASSRASSRATSRATSRAAPPLNTPELRFFLLICAVDLLVGVLLFLIAQRLAEWGAYFRYVNQDRSGARQLQDERSLQNMSDERNLPYALPLQWKLIDPILLTNLYLNNPLTVLANSFLSLDNLKLLLITASFYLALRRIRSEASPPHKSTPNLIAILLVNAMLLYATSFHFILILIGVNNFVVYSHQGILFKHKLKVPLGSLHMLLIILQNLALLIATLAVYALLLLASAYVNSGSWSFLNNTLINEYKVLFLLPNLGNYWYLFSTMFRDYYHSFLFLFHFHVFLYPLPLLFRLVKTPLIYLKIMISIALVFHPNITVNDIVFSLLLLVIDYERTVYAIPFAKLIIILLGNLGLFFVTTNLWLRKNTGNANYAFFNQLIVFNITTFIITSSIKFYIRVQTPERQLQEGKCIVVSTEKAKFNLFQTLKETFM
ncbi:GPI transamidase subunit PIG-U, putative [Plasmodium vivax]|nr:GPI transamidase subunit PIG-U, putative [Plasmodium vivax]